MLSVWKRAIVAGFKTIICNRPDSEPGAVSYDSLKATAEAAAIPFIYQPVVSGAITDDDARQFAGFSKRQKNRCWPIAALAQMH